jgi:polyferredoxin/Na+-translocating ferredoxin:NAD+ oxidoreductase RnfG subunit
VSEAQIPIELKAAPEKRSHAAVITGRILSVLRHWLFGVALLAPLSAHAAFPTLNDITLDQVRVIFNDADTLGPRETAIPARGVLHDNNLIGYVALSSEIIAIPGYSGKPLAVLIGVNPEGVIAGAHIIYHEEPILVAGIQESQLQDFVRQYQGKKADAKIRIGARNRTGYEGVDGISGATITAMILNQSIMTTAKNIATEMQLPRAAAASTQPAADGKVEIPAWEYNWRDKFVHLIILGIALLGLLNILFFQDWLVRRTRLFNIIRNAFLLFTVFYIGFWHLAQLSIINILTFVRLVTDQFTWHTLLIDPLIFQLWSFIALVSLLWGGGVFCGWLCPFGAMQELIYKITEKLNTPKFEIPAVIHERLLAIKYFILIGLVGLSLESLTSAARLAEVEPFKTTFIFHFQRPPVYAIYAIGLLVLSGINSKFFCKYLCPLGAALSFITRFRVFDWLRRRKECGRPCQTCAAHCQMQAIKPTGEIIATECTYCLECQVLYWDEHRCPPLVDKHERRKRRQSVPIKDGNPAMPVHRIDMAQVNVQTINQPTFNSGESS